MPSLSELLQGYTQRNPGVTNYSLNLMGPESFIPTQQTWTNLPNTLVIDAHGSSGVPGFFPATNDAMSPLNQALTPYVPPRERRRHPPGPSPISLEQIAQSMGVATNDVHHIINTACYGAGNTAECAKQLFPNLEEYVAPDSSKKTTVGLVKQQGEPEATPQSIEQYMTNYPGGDVSPLMSRPLTANTTNLSKWLAPHMLTLVGEEGLPGTEPEDPNTWLRRHGELPYSGYYGED